MDERIRVAVIESEEVLGRGVMACLADDRRVRVTAVSPSAALAREFHVAVVSSEAAAEYRYPCPIVVCGNGYVVSSGLTAENEVAALLHRGSMTGEQLRASVHAAVTGLKVKPPDPAQEQLDPRSLHVLELIADGLSTREIADALSYSERTIKKVITRLERTLGARNRAHAIALAVRQSLI